MAKYFIMNLFFFSFSCFFPPSSSYFKFCHSQLKGRTLTLPLLQQISILLPHQLYSRTHTNSLCPCPYNKVHLCAFHPLNNAKYFHSSCRNHTLVRSPAVPSATQIPAPYANTSRSTRPKSNRCAER